jgi:hypothetical protein
MLILEMIGKWMLVSTLNTEGQTLVSLKALRFKDENSSTKKTMIPYLTVRAEEVCMVHENTLEKSGHSKHPKFLHKKECEIYLFDRIPQYLMNSAAVQKYLSVELETSETYILVGSRLPQGGSET